MKFLNKRFSVNGPQTTAMACEACVYGRGEHKEFCSEAKNDPAVGSDEDDADLDLLRTTVGAAAESVIPGAGARAGAQVPEVREPVEAYPGQRNVHAMIDQLREENARRRMDLAMADDYVPAVGGCSCCGDAVRAGGCN